MGKFCEYSKDVAVAVGGAVADKLTENVDRKIGIGIFRYILSWLNPVSYYRWGSLLSTKFLKHFKPDEIEIEAARVRAEEAAKEAAKNRAFYKPWTWLSYLSPVAGDESAARAETQNRTLQGAPTATALDGPKEKPGCCSRLLSGAATAACTVAAVGGAAVGATACYSKYTTNSWDPRRIPALEKILTDAGHEKQKDGSFKYEDPTKKNEKEQSAMQKYWEKFSHFMAISKWAAPVAILGTLCTAGFTYWCCKRTCCKPADTGFIPQDSTTNREMRALGKNPEGEGLTTFGKVMIGLLGILIIVFAVAIYLWIGKSSGDTRGSRRESRYSFDIENQIGRD